LYEPTLAEVRDALEGVGDDFDEAASVCDVIMADLQQNSMVVDGVDVNADKLAVLQDLRTLFQACGKFFLCAGEVKRSPGLCTPSTALQAWQLNCAAALVLLKGGHASPPVRS